MADPQSNIIGLVKSVTLNSYSQIQTRKPILVIEAKASDKGACDILKLRRLGQVRHEFTVPIDNLETPNHCERWIEATLRSVGLEFIADTTGNPKVKLRKLIWRMKQKPGVLGEVYTGVVKMGVSSAKVPLAGVWKNDVCGEYKGAEGSHCCAICLNVFVEISSVVELPCSHVFHSRCIVAWMSRKRNCPYCRSPVEISGFGCTKKLGSAEWVAPSDQPFGLS